MKQQIGVRGEYSIDIFDKNGNKVRDTIHCDNLILDGFLQVPNQIFVGNRCVIGSGIQTEPKRTDTQLGNLVAQSSTSNMLEQTGSRVITPESITLRFYRSFQFTGLDESLTEVGILKGQVLIAKSLIKDSEGNPTVLKIEKEQTLKINYSIYIRFSLEPQKISVELPYGTANLVFGRFSNPPSSRINEYEWGAFGLTLGVNSSVTTSPDYKFSAYARRQSGTGYDSSTSSPTIVGNKVLLSFNLPPVSYERILSRSSAFPYFIYSGDPNALVFSVMQDPDFPDFKIPANYNFKFDLEIEVGFIED